MSESVWEPHGTRLRRTIELDSEQYVLEAIEVQEDDGWHVASHVSDRHILETISDPETARLRTFECFGKTWVAILLPEPCRG